jgi:hypothetical protein
MPGDGERYDVVVVGVQGDDATAGDLSADLSSLTGLSAAKVSLALRNGELIVHRSLPDADARRAANALRRRGADVQIRSIDEAPAGVPDIDAMLGGAGLLLPHAGGAPAPIAPPPEFGGVTRARNVETAPRASGSGLLDPSRPQGRPEDPSSERPFAGAFERATERGRPTPHGSPRSGRAAEEPQNDEPKKIRDNYVGTPRRSKPPEARGVAGQIADAQRLAESLEAAAESVDVVEVVTLDGESSESVEVKLGAGHGAAAASGVVVAAAPPVTHEPVVEREPAPAARRPSDALALDFDGEAPPRAAVSGTQARVEAASVEAGPSARVSASPPARSQPASPRAVPSYGRGGASNRLFSPDPIANYLFGVAVGLAIGMVIAFVVVRMWSRGDVLALEEELAVSYTKPLQVESGESRTPAAIEDDLEGAYGRSRWFFLLTMIVVGVPVGLGLGHFKR